MKSSKVGFAVIYRWRIRIGLEEQFQQAWESSRELGPADLNASALMAEATEESFEPVLMHPVQDYLMGG